MDDRKIIKEWVLDKDWIMIGKWWSALFQSPNFLTRVNGEIFKLVIKCHLLTTFGYGAVNSVCLLLPLMNLIHFLKSTFYGSFKFGMNGKYINADKLRFSSLGINGDSQKSFMKNPKLLLKDSTHFLNSMIFIYLVKFWQDNGEKRKSLRIMLGQ